MMSFFLLEELLKTVFKILQTKKNFHQDESRPEGLSSVRIRVIREIRVPTNICEIREICVKYIANFLDSSSFSFILFYSFPFAKVQKHLDSEE